MERWKKGIIDRSRGRDDDDVEKVDLGFCEEAQVNTCRMRYYQVPV